MGGRTEGGRQHDLGTLPYSLPLPAQDTQDEELICTHSVLAHMALHTPVAPRPEDDTPRQSDDTVEEVERQWAVPSFEEEEEAGTGPEGEGSTGSALESCT